MASRFSWSSLPNDMVYEIANRLKSGTDIQKFREVCRCWLAFRPPSSRLLSLFLPHKILPPAEYFWKKDCLMLVASNIYLLSPPPESGSVRPWLVRVEELNPGSLQVQHPLTHNWNIDLPEDFPMDLNLGNIRVTEAYTGYNLRRESANRKGVMTSLDINKVVLYTGKQGTSPVVLSDLIAVVLFLPGYLFKVRLSDNHWEPIKCGLVSRFDDVINFKGHIVVLDRKGRLYRLNCIKSPHTCIVSQGVPSNSKGETRKHLVELCEELYVVHFINPHFKVYKLDNEVGMWVEINSFGKDKILFVGPDCCFFSLTKDFPGWRGDSIVYHIDSFRTLRRDGHVFYSMHHYDPNETMYVGVYHMGDSTKKGVYTLAKYNLYADVLWPPPLWLRDSMHSSATVRGGLQILPEEALETDVHMVDG